MTDSSSTRRLADAYVDLEAKNEQLAKALSSVLTLPNVTHPHTNKCGWCERIGLCRCPAGRARSVLQNTGE